MSRIEKGLGPETIVEPGNQVFVVDGGPRQSANVVVSPERFEEYRTGYRCLRCHEVQDEPFPAVCRAHFRWADGEWRCGYEMRREQLAHLEAETTEQRYGPSPDDFDYEQELWEPKTGIYLPRGVKTD